MKSLTVLYDPHCGLCTEVRDWLRAQRTYIPLRLVASDSDLSRREFPDLPKGELAVVSDSGEVWIGDHAFIMCLWALRAFRPWATRLASPFLRPMARQAFELLSHNRGTVSALLHLKSEAELKKRLSEVSLPSCPIQ